MTDDISGLYYAQARYYSHDLGRFSGEDMIKGHTTLPMSLNSYIYCRNQPLMLVDKDGCTPAPSIYCSRGTDWCGGEETQPSRDWSEPPTPPDKNEHTLALPIHCSRGTDWEGSPLYQTRFPTPPPPQRIEGLSGFYAYAPHVTWSDHIFSWNREDGFGLSIFDASGRGVILGVESAIINDWVYNDNRVTVLSGDTALAFRFNPDPAKDSLVGLNLGVRLIRGETGFAIQLPFTNRYLVVGLEGEIGALGVRLAIQDGRFRIGKSAGLGWGLSFGLETRCDN